MDLGGTHLRIGVVDADCTLQHFEILPTAQFIGPALLNNLARTLSEYRQRYLPEEQPVAVSMGFPSTLNRARTRILSTPNIPGLDQVDMVAEMESRLGWPVLIDRDVNMLFRYDVHLHRLPVQGITLGCYIGTGFGNVIAIDGKILYGKNGVAGELGHIPVMGREDPCGCGNTGCMELYASGKALAALHAEHFAEEPIHELFIRHAFDPRIEAFVHALALPIATEVNLLDPEHVLLGGGVLQMPNFPRARLEHYLRLHARKPYPADTLCLHYTRMQQENGVIGAALHAFSTLHAQEESR